MRRGRAGRGPGPRVAWMFLTLRHRARQLVGVLRTRLGRLVVLGSGRERVLHAVARRHRADPFAGGHRKARRFKSWTVLLAICAFSLSLLGTFLVRSGVLTSVHAFATDPARGMFILASSDRDRRLARAVCVARAAGRRWAAAFALFSRESLLLSTTCCCRAAGSVLLGTLVSAVSRRARPRQDLGRAAVFRHGVRPADGAAVFLMGVGP